MMMLLPILFFTAIFALLCVLAKQVREQRLVVIGFSLLIAVLPLIEIFNIWAVSIMAVLAVIAFVFNKSRQFVWYPIFYATVGIYALSFVGLLHTGDFSFANKRIDTAIPLMVFPILFGLTQLSRRNVMLLLRFFLWIVIVLCAYGILSLLAVVPDFSWKTALLDGKQYADLFVVWPITLHPSALSVTLLMALPVSFYLRFHAEKQITLVEMLLAILLPILVTFMVGARIGVGVIPVLLGLAYLFYCKFKPVFKWGFVIVGVTVGLFLIFFVLPPDIKKSYFDSTRADFRKTAISAIKEKPVLGWGTWQQPYLIACEERARNLELEVIHPSQHFHNVYLDMMVQFGIVGIVALLCLILGIFKIAIHKKHFLLLSFAVMYILVFWVDNVLQAGRFVKPFMFWFCFLVANQKYLLEKRTSIESHSI